MDLYANFTQEPPIVDHTALADPSGKVILDFDVNGDLVGVEVVGATTLNIGDRPK